MTQFILYILTLLDQVLEEDLLLFQVGAGRGEGKPFRFQARLDGSRLFFDVLAHRILVVYFELHVNAAAQVEPQLDVGRLPAVGFILGTKEDEEACEYAKRYESPAEPHG
jgi:hypothetical protein